MGYIDRNQDTAEAPQLGDPYLASLHTAHATWGGWIFIGSLLLGGIFALFGRSPVTVGETYSNPIPAVSILISAVIAFLLFRRVRLGKGWIAGALLVGWWAIEIIGKIDGGTMNVGWGVAHLVSIFNLFLGVRACWQIRFGPGPSPAEENTPVELAKTQEI